MRGLARLHGFGALRTNSRSRSGGAPTRAREPMVSERNVKITRTFLGREDHGIPSFMLTTIANSTGQGFGGWDLRFYGVDMLMRVIETVGVESWEKLGGAYCRVRSENGLLKAIGHITEDRWYEPETHARGEVDS